MTEADDPEALQALRRLEAEMAAVRRELAILRYDLSGKNWLTVGEGLSLLRRIGKQFPEARDSLWLGA
jgi:hypothetical protein